MANELAHVTVGSELTQAEFEGTTLHQFDSQAAGDIAYASSTTQISRLAKGSDGDTLTLASGIPAWNTAVQTDATASRAIDGTTYQNTSGRPLIVTVTATSGGANDHITATCDSNSSPTTVICKQQLPNSGEEGCLTFVVIPSYYYEVDGSGSETLVDWFEWEI